MTAPSANASLTIRADQPGPVIDRNIYGHFAEHLGRCIYEGLWVGEDSPIPNMQGIRNDVVAALRKLHVPVLRWPGGCFADEYHWQDGIGPREQRPAMINTHWGGVVENNHFGTHEFMLLVEQLGCAPYICGNVGSGTVQEMMQWVEYLTSAADSPLANLRRQNGRGQPWLVPYFGVGNEAWGCGGNMRAEQYANEYRRYNTFIKDYDSSHHVFRVACGAAGDDMAWTETLMARAAAQMDGLSLHHYTLPTGNWSAKGSSTDFGEAEWFATLKRTLEMDALIQQHSAIMDRHDPGRRVALVVDEWGTWYDVLPGSEPGFLQQQSSLRDALAAALNLHIFQAHAERVRMANIAQTVNVLQSMILTKGDQMILTPTYWVFDMYKVHQDATLLPQYIRSDSYTFGGQSIPAVSASASRDKDGVIHITLVNVDPDRSRTVQADIRGVKVSSVSGRLLTAPTMQAHNTFEEPDAVKPVDFRGARLSGGMLDITLPSKSVVVLELR